MVNASQFGISGGIMRNLIWAVLMCASLASAQQGRSKARFSDISTGSKSRYNLRLFPLNLLENSLHLAIEQELKHNWAWGLEAAQTFGGNKSVLYPDIGFSETYFGPLVQYYLTKDFRGFFGEAGLNFTRVSISATTGLDNEVAREEGSYVMPHVSANYRLKTNWGLIATGGVGLFAFLGGDELKIDEIQKGYVDGVYTEKFTKVDTPYSASPKLRMRLDVGYSF